MSLCKEGKLMLPGRKWASTARPYAFALSLCLLLTGCVAPEPEPTPTPEPSAEASLSPVYSDWSKLEPYAPPQEK